LEVLVPEARKLLPRVALVLVLATLVVATLVWWRAQRQPKEIVLSGTLEARTVEVGSLTGGRVVRVLVDEGTHVVPGQTLVALETETIDRQIAEQNAVIESARAQLAKVVAGPRSEEIAKAAADPAASQTAVNAAIKQVTGKALKEAVLSKAWSRLTFTYDPLVSTLERAAQSAKSLGLLDSADIAGITDLTLLNEVLRAEGKPPVS